MDEVKDKVVALDLGCTPDAGVSGALLLQNEDKTYLTFNAMKRKKGGAYEDAGIAVVEFIRCIVTKFGYPNDEALAGHPLYSHGLSYYDIYEVLNSTWVAEKERQNLVSFPNPKNKSWILRHFIFTFHDSTFECLAEDVKLEIGNESYEHIFNKIAEKVISEEI